MALLTVVTGAVSLLAAVPPGHSSAVWLPAGVALAATLLYGNHCLPGVFVGSFLVQVLPLVLDRAWFPGWEPLLGVVGVAIGAVVQARVGAWLILLTVGFPVSLARVGPVLVFLALAGPVCSAIRPSVATASLVLAGVVPSVDAGFQWFVAWVGDTLAVLFVVPLVSVWLITAHRPRRYFQASAVPFFVGFTAVSVLFAYDGWRGRSELRWQFGLEAREVVEVVRHTVADSERGLETLGDLIADEGEVSQASFGRFTRGMLHLYPSLSQISWSPVVRGRDREAFEGTARAAGLEGFSILERHPSGQWVAAREKPYYVPLLYMEPWGERQGPTGIDLAASPNRRATLQSALRRRGQVTASEPRPMTAEDGKEAASIVLVRPVLAEGEAAQRALAGVLGFVTASVRVDQMIRGALPEEGIHGLGLTAVDMAAKGGEGSLWHCDPEGGQWPPGDLDSRSYSMVWYEEVGAGGRPWSLRIEASTAYLVANRKWTSWAVPGGGLVLSLLAVALQLMFAGRAVELVEINTRLEREKSGRRQAESALSQEKERALVTLHTIGDAVITTNPGGAVEYLNRVAEELTGWSLGEVQGRRLEHVYRILDEVTGLPFELEREAPGSEGVGGVHSGLLISREGRRRAVEASFSWVKGREDRHLGMVVVFRDVTQARRTARQLAYQATHDSLTGLVNRREFENRMDQAIASSKAQGTYHVLCYLDLDQFKVVNDTVGHVAGDELLRQLTRVLTQGLRDRDTLARLGGDEFGLLLDNCPVEKGTQIAKALVARVRDFRFVWEGRVFHLSLSVGVTGISATTRDHTELMSQADVACYTAKDRGRNRVHLYDRRSGESARRHDEILRAASLREAVESGSFELYCQAIVNVDEAELGPQRYELLLRLRDPRGSVVVPGAFIPAAERFNLMPAIDRWVISASFEALSEQSHLLRHTEFSINLSATSLVDDGLLEFVQAELQRFEIPGGAICFEITETAAVHHLEQAGHFVSEVKRSGCRVALDDFGSGFASFSHVRELDIDYLKIDGSFVRGMIESPTDRAVVAAINDVGHALGIKTVAEWVENRTVFDELGGLGVDLAQGFSLGRPVPLDSMIGSAVA